MTTVIQKDWTKEAREVVDRQEYLLMEELSLAVLVEISEKLTELNKLLMDRTRLF
jgi:hypothetical protein